MRSLYFFGKKYIENGEGERLAHSSTNIVIHCEAIISGNITIFHLYVQLISVTMTTTQKRKSFLTFLERHQHHGKSSF